MDQKIRMLLIIITEASLESKISLDIEKLGGKGYTIIDARGKGHRGTRDADWSVDSNIRIEIICKKDIAEKIMNYMKKNYYDNFAMVIYNHEVSISRSMKF